MREYKRALKVAVALVTLSVVAATSSTLAWATTRRSLSISFSDATVRADDTNLMVNFKHSFNTMSVSNQTFSTLSLATETTVTDISGDGIHFYEPMWSGQYNTTENGGDGKSTFLVNQINDVSPRKPGTNSPGDPGLSADGRLVDFTLTLSRNEDATSGIYVFLGEETSIDLLTSGNPNPSVISALRMAVVGYSDGNMDTGIAETIYLHAPEVEPDPTYLVMEGRGAYGSVGFSFAENVDLKTEAFQTIPDYEEAILHYPPVADLTTTTGSASADVTFRLWIEGTDKDALDPIVYQEFGLVLDLYVINAD